MQRKKKPDDDELLIVPSADETNAAEIEPVWIKCRLKSFACLERVLVSSCSPVQSPPVRP